MSSDENPGLPGFFYVFLANEAEFSVGVRLLKTGVLHGGEFIIKNKFFMICKATRVMIILYKIIPIQISYEKQQNIGVN